MLPMITIATEKGNNVDKIAEMISKTLNIKVVDKFLIEEITEKNGLTSFNSKRPGEFRTQFDIFTNTNFYNGMLMGSGQSDLDHIRHMIVKEEAKKGPCIIVGKCARDIMKEEGYKALNVFLYTEKKNKKDDEKKEYDKYDLALNVTALGEEFCAEMIAAAAKKMEKEAAA